MLLAPEEQVSHTIEGRTIEGNSTIDLDPVRPFVPGSGVTDRRVLGVVGVQVLSGAAATNALALAREETVRSPPSRVTTHATVSRPRRRTVTRSRATGSARDARRRLIVPRVVRSCGQVIGVR